MTSPVFTPTRTPQSAEQRRLLNRAVLDLKRRPRGPLGVVLVGDRRPEHRHQGIANDLVHGASEALHDLPHLLHATVHHRADLLGVGALRERGELGQVGEQDGHPAPLPLLAVATAGGRGASVLTRGATRPAEAEVGRVVPAARSAVQPQRRSAVTAEALRSIVELGAGGAGCLPGQRSALWRVVGLRVRVHVAW